MLQLTGKTLDVTTETVNPPNGGSSFVSTTVKLLCGVGAQTSVETVRLGRDFEGEHPKPESVVTMTVVISAFATRNGAGYRLTALAMAPAAAGARIAS